MPFTWVLAVTIVALVAGGCSSGYEALGTHTARVLINGSEIEERPPIRCEQVGWVWFIESLQQKPGFTAQVHTGDTVGARLVRIEDLGGFTGSAWNATAPAATATAATAATAVAARVETDATLTEGTFTITGTAVGYYSDDPSETATADFEIRTDC